MSDRSTVLLEHHLKELKLPTFLREYGKVAGQCAEEGVDHPGYLLRLSELELIDRHHRMVDRRIKAARFPATKSLDTFDFLAMPSVNKHLVMQLARCEYVDRRENVIAVGNSGTGKTHVALGLGLAACQRGLSVGFTTAASLVHELIEARDERRLLNLQKKLARLKQPVRVEADEHRTANPEDADGCPGWMKSPALARRLRHLLSGVRVRTWSVWWSRRCAYDYQSSHFRLCQQEQQERKVAETPSLRANKILRQECATALAKTMKSL